MEEEVEKLIFKLMKKYISTCTIVEKLKKLRVKVRKPNFPEIISEYIIQKLLSAEKPKYGDLKIGNKKIEVKCIASTGPISFGPKENWDYIVLIDCLKFPLLRIIIYNISNKSDVWLDIKISKKETFRDQIKQKRRPRISLKELEKSLPVTKNYNINIEDIFNNNFEKN